MDTEARKRLAERFSALMVERLEANVQNDDSTWDDDPKQALANRMEVQYVTARELLSVDDIFVPEAMADLACIAAIFADRAVGGALSEE